VDWIELPGFSCVADEKHIKLAHINTEASYPMIETDLVKRMQYVA
jgi:hypothetical protein